MAFLAEFESHLPADLRKQLREFDTPFSIQQYLDDMPYIGERRDRSPLNVMLDRQCQCLDGGFLAALLLWRIGHKPLLIDLVPEPGKDDDHVLALYKVEGRWGVVAKSNYVNLGFREPVYRNLRELVMIYFEQYVSYYQEKTLRAYTRPLDASRYTQLNWAWDEAGAYRLYHEHFYRRKAIPVIAPSMAQRLSPVAARVYAAETLHTKLEQSFGNRKPSASGPAAD
jgi:hypothetical protein